MKIRRFSFVSKTATGVLLFIVGVVAGEVAAQEPTQVPPVKLDDSGTSGSLQRIRLNPVIKRDPEIVVLRPVLKGADSPTSATLSIVPPTTAPIPSAGSPLAEPAVITARPRPELPPSQELHRAKGLLRDGKTEDARVILHALAVNHPRSPEAPEALLLAAGTVPDLDAARKELREVVLNYPLSASGRQALARIGDYSFILGDYEESVKAFKAFRKLETDPILLRQADVQLALALLRSGEFDEARTEFASLRSRYPDLEESPEMLEGEAEALIAVKQIAEADRLLERVENEFPNYTFRSKVLLSRALCAELDGRIEDAQRIYRTVAENYEGSIEATLAGERLADLADPIVARTSASLSNP